jgi:steroid delta-isomerase-like uncharacterized protein
MAPATADVLIRQWFDELWNQGKEETIDRLLSPDAQVHGLPTPDGKPLVGPAAFKELYRVFRSAFPDMTITIERMVASGDGDAAVQVRATGTHRGDSLGMPATNRRVNFHGMVIIRAVNGKMVEGLNCFDFLTMYQQIGVVPAIGG